MMTADQAIARAHRCFDAGQAPQAAALCRQALQAEPAHHAALHLLGLIAHRGGDTGGAVRYLAEACKSPSSPALYFSNLAEMQRRLGRLGDAEVSARQAVARGPELASAWNNFGIILQEAGKHEESLACLQRAATGAPDSAELHNNLGNTLARLGRLAQARVHYLRALRLNPAYAEAHSNLAALLHLLGEYGPALAAVEAALAHDPRLADAYINAASILLASGHIDAAEKKLDLLFGFAPEDFRALLLQAQILEAGHRPAEALAACRRALRQRPTDGEGLLTLAKLLRGDGQTEAARAAAEHAASRLPDPSEASVVQASFAIEAGDQSAALAMLGRNPGSAAAWLTRSDLQKFDRGCGEIKAMEDLLANAQGLNEQLCLRFALAKAYLDHGDAGNAFAHLAAGNRRKRATIDFDLARTTAWMGAIAAAFSADRFATLQGGHQAGAEMIFIIGMPRAGTSLVEQILASHSAVHGAGELRFGQEMVDRLSAKTRSPYPDFAAALNADLLSTAGAAYLHQARAQADRTYVVDKMPSNFLQAGLLHLALPNARFIHIKRDAADTCFSCYTKLFAGAQAFAYDQRELGGFHLAYQALTSHWQAVLPAQHYLELDYEDLVADLESQSRRLLAFCGLAWDPACLRFFETQRPVRTASATQVRTPLYATSVGRARRYGDYLRPLFTALTA